MLEIANDLSQSSSVLLTHGEELLSSHINHQRKLYIPSSLDITQYKSVTNHQYMNPNVNADETSSLLLLPPLLVSYDEYRVSNHLLRVFHMH